MTWNAQAFFCRDAGLHATKVDYLKKLLVSHDFVASQETHGTIGSQRAFRPPAGATAFWAPGSAARAGVGLVVKDSFLSLFDCASRHWQILEAGRLAVLRIRGQLGCLNLVVCYFPTGTRTAIEPRETSPPSPLPQPAPEDDASLLQQRLRLIRQVGALPQGHVLTVISGDFNWVPTDFDRLRKGSSEFSGASDAREADEWTRLVASQQVHEIWQGDYTHDGPQTRARLDRVYCDMHLSWQLDREVYACPLEWQPLLSQHRALSFGRIAAARHAGSRKAIDPGVFKDPQWKLRVVARSLRLAAAAAAPQHGFGRLAHMKEAMIEVSADMTAELRRRRQPAEAADTQLGAVMRALRFLEARGSFDFARFHSQVPQLAAEVFADRLVRDRPAVLRTLRDAAVRLARDDMRARLEQLQRDVAQLPPEVAARRRSSVMRSLSRLVPGKASTMRAVECADGSLAVEPDRMAEALRMHWGRVFSAKPVRDHLVEDWLTEDRADPNGFCAALAPELGKQWNIRRRDIAAAVAQASPSAAGPDGLPYVAWQALGDIGIELLWEVAKEMGSAGGEAAMLEAFPLNASGVSAFNAALAFFIPKKSERRAANGEGFHQPGDLRPITVCNTDNRLIANAARLRWEERLAPVIAETQRGFLPGRSMARNVFEVDAAMRSACALGEAGGAVFFDFEAAFPSLAHTFLHRLLRSAGLPVEVCRFVRGLYLGHGCDVALQGGTCEGFSIGAGIRQGCPLSPLLFAFALEPFLRRLRRLSPSTELRAYADDLAAVDLDLERALRLLLPEFAELARVAGLRLNLAKVQVVPLGDATVQEVSLRLATLFPGWAAVKVRRWAEYLGAVLGPDASAHCWDKPLAKFEARALQWAAAGLGLYWTCVAYNVYVISVLGFTLQFAGLPASWPQYEARAFRRLFPGPGNWIQPADLRRLRGELELPAEAVDLQELEVAVAMRLLLREARAEGGLCVRELDQQVRAAFTATQHVGRIGCVFGWFFGSCASRVLAVARRGADMGVTGDVVEAQLRGGMPRPLTRARQHHVERGVQSTVRALLRARRPPHWPARLRAKLAKWEVTTLPGRRPQRALRALGHLRRLVAPRVRAAVLRTWLDGWATKRRFQSSGCCLWGCDAGQDSVAHYARCMRLGRLAQEVFGLPLPVDVRDRADRWLLFGLADGPRDALRRGAVGLAAAYLTHCSMRDGRHGHRQPAEEVAAAYRQHARQLVARAGGRLHSASRSGPGAAGANGRRS